MSLNTAPSGRAVTLIAIMLILRLKKTELNGSYCLEGLGKTQTRHLGTVTGLKEMFTLEYRKTKTHLNIEVCGDPESSSTLSKRAPSKDSLGQVRDRSSVLNLGKRLLKVGGC